MYRSTVLLLMLTLTLALVACGDGDDTVAVESVPDTPRMCADVENAEITAEAGGTFQFDVTVRSAETGWDKYADAWEVRGPDGTVLGTRILAHPHVDEQPFTRSLSGVTIPEEITQVEVAARDLVEGFCGATMGVRIPGR